MTTCDVRAAGAVDRSMARLAALALVVACATLVTGGRAVFAAGQATGLLRIREVVVPGSPIPIEGELSYVRATPQGGGTARRARIPYGGKPVTLRLPAGSYLLAVWHRTCDANCGMLDPPTDRCQARVSVRVGTTVAVTVRHRFGTPCRIAVGR